MLNNVAGKQRFALSKLAVETLLVDLSSKVIKINKLLRPTPVPLNKQVDGSGLRGGTSVGPCDNRGTEWGKSRAFSFGSFPTGMPDVADEPSGGVMGIYNCPPDDPNEVLYFPPSIPFTFTSVPHSSQEAAIKARNITI